jgi:hypothetical protein
MPYYPSSQLKSNLYTNGGEYILSTTKENYKGYYYETSSGTKYTGKTPQDGPNILLIERTPLNTTKKENDFNILTGLESPNLITTINYKDTTIYLNLFTNSITNERSLPLSNPTTPTQQDQNLGVFQRYFCKKNNELKYLEIDKSTHNKLKSQQQDIAWDLYTPVSTLWYIKGEKEQTYKANKGLVTLIEQKQNWYGFTQWFQDKFLKYYLES